MSMQRISRRKFLEDSSFAALGLLVVLGRPYRSFVMAQGAGEPYAAPPSPRTTLNFNCDWRFVREDQPGAQASDFDDSKWTSVATPHSFNDIDSFRDIISHGAGDRGTYKGISWYRKHFKLPADLQGRKVFIEFEGMR